MLTTIKQHSRKQKPPWLKRRLPTGPDFEQVKTLVNKGGLHTVCQEAKC
ncbi:MAG: lipoyl synthase, partial [Desulfobacterales bacterium]|nr:lipoyl synthase [Desulfobacterales bacterium]MDX2510273.1 lipoyl synthase [Desulfobacterales bacterium]